MSDQPRAAGATPGLSTASPTGAHTVVGDLAGLFGNIPIGIFPTKPKQNYCVYFGPRSVIATELDFSSFFDQPHTIAGWFMPQYTVGSCHGPLFAASGPERYFVGQGDYRSGNTLTTKMNLAPGVATKAGDPVLAVYAGSESRIFLAPTFKSGVWQHVAVVRQPALSTGDVLALYLNGKKLDPVTVTANYVAGGLSSKTVSSTSDLALPASLHGADLGQLVLGRSIHPTSPSGYAQAYGLLDDVAVFDHALTPATINDLIAKKRLSGYETGLVAGWGFDVPSAGNILPAKLSAAISEQGVDPNLTVSSDRNSDADKGILDNPWVIAVSTPTVKFPFAAGDAWQVIQGYCNPTVSHNGDAAAFSYDLRRVVGASGNTPVHAAAGGYVFNYFNHPTPSGAMEGNTVNLYNDQMDLGVTYMHLADNSLPEAVVDGDPIPAGPPDYLQVWPEERMIYGGQEVGKDGPVANHLHLAGWETFVPPNMPLTLQVALGTIPIAFEDVEVLTTDIQNWFTPLGPYIPKQDDQVRAKT